MNRSERGTAAILVAGSMLLLLGMAAVALDLGAAWNERRQDQTSSDLAAVAGGLSYGDNADIVSQVMSNSRQNLDSSYSDAEWSSLWINCTDPDRPAGFTPISTGGDTYDCISLNPSFLRVRVPDQIRDTSFGRVLGVDTITTSADTIVTLLPPSGTGLLPFAVRGGSQSGELCLDTQASHPSPPCDGNEKGSFGNIAPPLFGNPFMGTDPDCSVPTSANNNVPAAIAMGIDHVVWKFPQASWNATGWDPSDNTSKSDVANATNIDECTDTGGEIAEAADGIPIESVYVDTGNSTKADVTEGLITGENFADGLDARMSRSNNTRLLDGYPVDNTPLWSHLLPATGAGGHGVSACDPDDFATESDLDTKNIMIRDCLETYETDGETAQIFDDSILDTPRFGVAPMLWHENLGSGMTLRPVETFALVYLAGIELKDGTIFYPDDLSNSAINPTKADVEQLTGYMLLPDMVSEDVQNFYPGFTDDSLTVTIYQ